MLASPDAVRDCCRVSGAWFVLNEGAYNGTFMNSQAHLPRFRRTRTPREDAMAGTIRLAAQSTEAVIRWVCF